MKKVMIALVLGVLIVGISGCKCPFMCKGKCDGTRKSEMCDKAKKVCEACGKPMAECVCKAAE